MPDNFTGAGGKISEGELWENTYFRLLAEVYEWDEILYWRTADGNEVDFVLPHAEPPYAIEVKFDEIQINPGKYKKFTGTYPGIPLSFVWLNPFDENTFSRYPVGENTRIHS